MLKTLKWHLLMFFKCDAVNETGKTQMLHTSQGTLPVPPGWSVQNKRDDAPAGY